MVEQQAKLNQLLAELDDDSTIEAALVATPAGAVKGRVGASPALAAAAGGTDRFVRDADDDASDNVYVRAVGEDFLLVLFDEDVDFDALKRRVDQLVGQLEL